MIDAGHRLTDKKLEELEELVGAEYKRAHRDMVGKLNAYMAQFQAEDRAQQALLRAGKITQKEYQDWQKRHIMMGARWQAMRDTLAEDYHNTNVIARKLAYGTMKDVYALNHNYAVYQIQHDAKIQFAYTLYDRRTVERILRDNPKLFHDPGKRMQARIAANRDLRWNRRQVNSAIMQGIMQGEPINKIARRLELVTERNWNAAVRNARTAVTGAQNAGRVDGYRDAQEMGVKLMQEWVATIDSRTRHEHRYLNGQRVPVGEPFETEEGDKIMYPGDPDAEDYLVYNCRCTIVGQIDGYETDRVEESPKMGEMTYDEWVEQG